MREVEGVKREATITAGVLRPRYLRTYARPAPVNRAKEARLRLDRGHGFDEKEGNHEEKEVASQLVSMIMKERANITVRAGSRQHQRVEYEVNPPCRWLTRWRLGHRHEEEVRCCSSLQKHPTRCFRRQ